MYDSAPPCVRFLPFPQSAPYALAARACGAQVSDADLGAGHAQVVQRGCVRLINRGPLWSQAAGPCDRSAALRRMARWPGLTIATPDEDIRGRGLVPLITPMHHALWDLAGDLRERLRGNWRNQLAGAERSGMVLCRGDAATMAQLIAADAAQSRQRGYRNYSAAFSHALPAKDLRIWRWDDGGSVGAAMAFVVHGTSATYHLAWANDAARHRAVHNLMLWQAARSLANEGVQWLDLGAVSDAAPGLAHFKLGTGARLRRLGHTMLVLPG